MEDGKIVDLYWARSETAITETTSKYGKYCYRIAYNILYDREDADESVNDTWLSAWNSMPPHRPSMLSTFLGKITRRVSLNRWRDKHAQKRGGGEIPLALEELEDCIPSRRFVEDEVEAKELGQVIDRFLDTLQEMERNVFIRRYWNLDSVRQIGEHFGFSESKVKTMLWRTREKLAAELEREGTWL
ncbi:MAG: sigma-70 family RNA polymerase sigma factor [Lachnospiraceae bacterium]|nr:sigma-70 family RNA polymerase sigma factor [Lachnospiraceae bacterium]